MSETDGDGSVGKGSVGMSRGKGKGGLDGSVNEKEEVEREESDGEMEEAGGTDE
jgi:AMP deaminase